MKPLLRERKAWLALVGITAGAALAGMAVAGCGRTADAGLSACCAVTARTGPVSHVVPEGWQTATYGTLSISVPAAWAVEHDTNCPAGGAPGTLLLGYPKVLEYCPNEPGGLSVVSVIADRAGPSPGPVPAQGKPVLVNGVAVYVGFGSPSELQWSVPSLGVEITGVGPLTRWILATLRRS